jgi:hypothetical protein
MGKRFYIVAESKINALYNILFEPKPDIYLALDLLDEFSDYEIKLPQET